MKICPICAYPYTETFNHPECRKKAEELVSWGLEVKSTLITPSISITYGLRSLTYPEAHYTGWVESKEGGLWFWVDDDQWAPGVFAGSEGMMVVINGESKIIKSIDMERKIIIV